MVEFNANGLYAFFHLMKNLSVATVKFGKEWVWWLVEKSIEFMRRVREWLRQKVNEYFIKKDLTKDELQT